MKFLWRTFAFMIGFLLPTFLLHAADTFVALNPKVTLSNGKELYSGDISQYVNNLWSFGIAIAGALAVIQITIGGITYMVSEAAGTKGEAIGKIQASIEGLLLALCAYIILYTINPKLVELHFNISSVN